MLNISRDPYSKPASVNERADALREKGIPDIAIQAALDELGLEEIPYQRDYFGRIIAPNFDAFGKPVYKQGPLSK